MSNDQKGFVDSAIDAMSGAAAAVGNAATNLKDKVTHMGNAASEKTEEKASLAQKEEDKQIAKDSNARVGDRLSAAGHAVKDYTEEKSHQAEYEKEKRLAQH